MSDSLEQKMQNECAKWKENLDGGRRKDWSCFLGSDYFTKVEGTQECYVTNSGEPNKVKVPESFCGISSSKRQKECRTYYPNITECQTEIVSVAKIVR